MWILNDKYIISNIIIGTGSYDNVKSGNTVSITGDGGTAWGYFCSSYKKLAPRLVIYTRFAENFEKGTIKQDWKI